jgi:hypothetical protein
MIRDLKYPEDAREAIASLLGGLAYDAAVAVAGIALSKIPQLDGKPDFSVPIRCGGFHEDSAVRRDAPILFSRFSLISMVSRFEVHAQNLLLQRRVLEYLRGPVKKMDGPNLWRILIQVKSESRQGPVKMCNGLIITQPSDTLKERMEWLDGLYRVRNCLAHRLGRVQMIDVKPPDVPLDQTKDDDRLRAVWLRLRVSVDGQEIQLPYFATKEAQAKVEFERHIREWKIGDQIDVDPLDCQSIALSFSLLAQQLQKDFEREMNGLLGLPLP